METNYQKLDLFEAGIVTMIALGIGLILLLGFSSLNKHQQTDFVSALNMFDMHEQWVDQADRIKFIAFDVPQDFLDEFYLAFTAVAVIPVEQISELAVIPETFQIAYASTGKVLGASFDTESVVVSGCGEVKVSHEALRIPYYYQKSEFELSKVDRLTMKIFQK